jgi:hypothetical protein
VELHLPVSTGGGAKRAHNLFFFDPDALCLCLGAVGSGGRRFCIRPKVDDSSTCGVSKHVAKFEPTLGHYYLKSNDAMAFCEPCLSQDLVPPEFCGNMLTTQKTMEEWKQVFVDYAGITVPNALEQPTQYIFPDPNRLALKTPKKLPQEHQSDRLLIIPIELEDIVSQDEETLTRDQCWWKEENED